MIGTLSKVFFKRIKVQEAFIVKLLGVRPVSTLYNLKRVVDNFLFIFIKSLLISST